MVALELFTVSSIYTAGSLTRYFMEKMFLRDGIQKLSDDSFLTTVTPPSQVEKFIELSVEEKEYQSPTYIGVSNGGFVGVPVGGGTTYEMKTLLSAAIAKDRKDNAYNWTFTDLQRKPCVTPIRYWLNTPDDLKNFFENNGIPQSIAPLRLPMQVREISIPESVKEVYGVIGRNVLGTNKDAVICAAAAKKSIGSPWFRPAVILAAATSAWLYGTWNEYDAVEKRKRWGLPF